MARPRAASGADAPKEPHAVSLKGTQIVRSMGLVFEIADDRDVDSPSVWHLRFRLVGRNH